MSTYPGLSRGGGGGVLLNTEADAAIFTESIRPKHTTTEQLIVRVVGNACAMGDFKTTKSDIAWIEIYVS